MEWIIDESGLLGCYTNHAAACCTLCSNQPHQTHSDRISMPHSYHSWAYQNIRPTFPPLNTMSNTNIPSRQPSPFRNLNHQPPSHWLSPTPNPPPTNQSATQNLQQTSHPIISSSDLQQTSHPPPSFWNPQPTFHPYSGLPNPRLPSLLRMDLIIPQPPTDRFSHGSTSKVIPKLRSTSPNPKLPRTRRIAYETTNYISSTVGLSKTNRFSSE